ncbi:unnamed protein product [Didymodactylos carnosus]|uniref:Uncharacterized protein n=1 Tax=Didymodactylos carnosus TaxID=1234261 RepID=A0A8S2CSN2_9BILA|nr:unnamed protein product [Didymodactylos carnosus]CAF3531929.1 unnamed protein product [Didymodactylos carnosus]
MHSRGSWSVKSEPQNYEQIYDYFRQILINCSKSVDTIEQSYYHQHQSSVRTTLTTWSKPLNDLRNCRQLQEIRNGKTIRDLLNDIKTGEFIIGPVSNESILLLRRITERTNQILNTKLPELAKTIEECMSQMEQYFLSFYQIEHVQDIVLQRRKEKLPDENVETAYTYEKCRWEHMTAVNKSMRLIQDMKMTVENVKGVQMAQLSRECQELAIRTHLQYLPYVFAVPECFVEARKAIKELETWLEEDTLYNSFILKSIKKLDEKVNNAKKELNQAKTQLINIEHKVRFSDKSVESI